MSFSEVNITNTQFKDSTQTNAIKEVTSSSLSGAYLFVSLGVTLQIVSCTFSSGLAAQGGAIFISGLSSVTIRDSTFSSNYAN
jgi:hypothetical protein